MQSATSMSTAHVTSVTSNHVGDMNGFHGGPAAVGAGFHAISPYGEASEKYVGVSQQGASINSGR